MIVDLFALLSRLGRRNPGLEGYGFLPLGTAPQALALHLFIQVIQFYERKKTVSFLMF